MSRAGIELTPTVVRYARVSFAGRVVESLEMPWDPARPDDAVNALRGRTQRPGAIRLAVGLGFLEVARAELPRVAAVERAKILELEPDRYFAAATREAHVATVAPDESIAFATPAAPLEAWIRAFSGWAPVEWIEPAPASIARAIGPEAKGLYSVEAAEGETGLLQLERGRVTSVRRTRDVMNDVRALPSVGSVPATFVAAAGAARWRASAGAPPALAPESRRRAMATRQRAAFAASLVAAVAAVIFAIWSADRWRERTLAELDARIAGAMATGAAADSALQRVRSRENEVALIRDLNATRADPLSALAAFSAALPKEATVLSARANGNDWQLDGTTTDASALVPLLDRRQRFDSVRFLSASSRYREGNRSYETFSIAFRFRP